MVRKEMNARGHDWAVTANVGQAACLSAIFQLLPGIEGGCQRAAVYKDGASELKTQDEFPLPFCTGRGLGRGVSANCSQVSGPPTPRRNNTDLLSPALSSIAMEERECLSGCFVGGGQLRTFEDAGLTSGLKTDWTPTSRERVPVLRGGSYSDRSSCRCCMLRSLDGSASETLAARCG
jgi:hypothetical protein